MGTPGSSIWREIFIEDPGKINRRLLRRKRVTSYNVYVLVLPNTSEDNLSLPDVVDNYCDVKNSLRSRLPNDRIGGTVGSAIVF
ncbi:hypothetical protein VP1G_11336 [Cytospora mali]|uniref:Uncharacterized protein n=1 Tax=Cytospora mali TaxID=578113 RepID=A0A194VDR2_CYTMA|nr:hypothetical protein VP1G_11336 [Valsa mali var. pyri (nom. inval.)]